MFHFRKLMSKGVRAFVTYKEGACIELLVGAADSQPRAAASSGKGVFELVAGPKKQLAAAAEDFAESAVAMRLSGRDRCHRRKKSNLR